MPVIGARRALLCSFGIVPGPVGCCEVAPDPGPDQVMIRQGAAAALKHLAVLRLRASCCGACPDRVDGRDLFS